LSTHPEQWTDAWDKAHTTVEPVIKKLDMVTFRAKHPHINDPLVAMAWDAVLVSGDWPRDDRKPARNAARDAVYALIAWDDSTKYLTMPSDQLRVWATLSEDISAGLLLPAVIAFEQISELELV